MTDLPVSLVIYASVIVFILGAVFGSFLNCMAWRIVHGESVVKGRSHCPACGHVLQALDLVPIFSYLFLHGRCRYCGKKISPRCLWTELILALLFLGNFLRFGFSLEAVFSIALTGILFCLSLVDYDSLEIPNGFIITGLVMWIPYVIFSDSGWKTTLISGLIGGVVIAGILLLVSLIFSHVTGKDGMGGGDIKLIFMVDLYLGIWVGWFHLILACIIGLIIVKASGRKKIPFGPSISMAAYISMLIGGPLIDWYRGMLGI